MRLVGFCPVLHKLNIFGGVKLGYYKSMGEPHKGEGRGGGCRQILKFQWGGRGGLNFSLKFSRGKNLGGNYVSSPNRKI